MGVGEEVSGDFVVACWDGAELLELGEEALDQMSCLHAHSLLILFIKLTNYHRPGETYVKVKGAWKYLYRAVDKAGATVDFLLTARRDRKAALRFLRKVIGRHSVPEKITIDKSGANTAAIASYNANHDAAVEIHQVKYLNDIVDQDHLAVKRMVKAMLGFKAFWPAAITIAGIEIMHMIHKGQLRIDRKVASGTAVLFVGGISLFRLLDRIPPFAKLRQNQIVGHVLFSKMTAPFQELVAFTHADLKCGVHNAVLGRAY